MGWDLIRWTAGLELSDIHLCSCELPQSLQPLKRVPFRSVKLK